MLVLKCICLCCQVNFNAFDTRLPCVSLPLSSMCVLDCVGYNGWKRSQPICSDWFIHIVTWRLSCNSMPLALLEDVKGRDRLELHALPIDTQGNRSCFSLHPCSRLAKGSPCDGSCLLWKCQQVHTARLDWCNNHIIRVVSPFPRCNTEKELSIMCCSSPF